MKEKRLILLMFIFLMILYGCSPIPTEPNEDNKPNEIGISEPENDQNTYQLTDFYMIDENHGWAFSENKVLKTQDGGLTWLDVSPANFKLPPSPEQFNHFFLDQKEGWISITNFENMEIYYTSDGGSNWKKSILPEQHIFSLTTYFINSQTGWILGESEPAMSQSDKYIFRTDNRGNDWDIITSSQETNTIPRVGYPSGMSFNTERTGYISYNYSTNEFIPVYKTNNGGKEWERLELKEPAQYTILNGYYSSAYPPVFKEDGQQGILLVRFVSNQESVFVPYITVDDGKTWDDKNGVVSDYSWFLNTVVGWAIDYQQNILFITRDGSERWEQTIPNINLTDASFIQFTSPDTGWALLEELYKTNDGGKTWKILK